MDKIEICNMALARIGVEAIETLTEASEPARACRQFYDHARRIVLRRFPWVFATRRAKLALLPVKPENFFYAYRYPAQCACLRKLYNENYDNIPAYTMYQVLSDREGLVIYTNEENVSAEYTADVQDCNLFDEHFADVLGWRLAAEIAFKLTGNIQITQMAEQQYGNLYLEAAANSENEQNMKDADPYTFVSARFGSGGGNEPW